ncbi:MAG: ketose-bisphosphate aldolase [Planctomycetota bacterium]
MALVPAKQVLAEAAKRKYGVGAYNVNNMEQVQAIMAAARETKSPVIMQASRNALKYASLVYLKHLMFAALEESPDIPTVVHLDHGPDLETCKQAIALGFSSVMIDGSIDYGTKDAGGGHPPRSFEENIRVTKEVVDYAHGSGVSVEGELGTLGGIEDDTEASKVQLTDPDEVEEFVAKTGVDMLALAIGTSHGAYKFKHEPKLAMELIAECKRRVSDTALVMHGSSSVPPELVEVVNRYGGKLKRTMGVPVSALQEAIRLGVSKINVDTDIRLAFTGAIRKVLAEEPEAFDQRKYLGPARDAVTKIIAQRMRDFGTAGHAGDYKCMTLEEMKRKYGR